MSQEIENLNIVSQEVQITPADIKKALTLSGRVRESVLMGRQASRDILDHNDHRLIVVVGPCSVHNVNEAHEYARRLGHIVLRGGSDKPN